ncbi:MAG: alpha/beta fold hydrolase [Rhodobacteraceae bacterium]|nr:alpha/beta fold hydrolase [Paracoccaceae bacterium]
MKAISTILVASTMLASHALADTATLNGAEIFYTIEGEGTPVMVMHGGLGLDHTYFRPYLDALENVQIIYYDHLGNGRSEHPEDFSELTFERFVADAEALRQHLDLGKIILIGHSYGGFIAQEYAAAHPDALKGLVLANTVPVFDYAPTLSGTDEQMAALGAVFSRPMESDEDFQTNWNIISQMYYHNYDAEIGAELDMNTQYSYQAWNVANGLLATFNTLEKLPMIDVPTLVIGGRHDGITPVEPGTARIAGLLPQAEMVVFENSGHFPFIEEPALHLETLQNWINGLE